MKRCLVLCAVILGLLLSAADISEPATDKQEKCAFEGTITKNVQGKYLLYLPQEYSKDDEEKRWPLVIYLHGSGEVGDDLDLVKLYGPPQMVVEGRHFPFILVSPQCPEDSWWSNEIDMLNGMLDHLEMNLNIDMSRVYLTGQSMGGYGTWAWAADQPHRFAAIAPVSGGGSIKEALLVKDVAIWVFHGDKDDAVPFAQAKEMVEAIISAGGNPRFTVHEGVGHEPRAISLSYENEEFWKWLLDQRNTSVEK